MSEKPFDAVREPDPADHPATAARLRRLALALFANGERRVCPARNEDALVRAYRLLELIGQARSSPSFDAS